MARSTTSSTQAQPTTSTQPCGIACGREKLQQGTCRHGRDFGDAGPLPTPMHTTIHPGRHSQPAIQYVAPIGPQAPAQLLPSSRWSATLVATPAHQHLLLLAVHQATAGSALGYLATTAQVRRRVAVLCGGREPVRVATGLGLHDLAAAGLVGEYSPAARQRTYRWRLTDAGLAALVAVRQLAPAAGGSGEAPVDPAAYVPACPNCGRETGGEQPSHGPWVVCGTDCPGATPAVACSDCGYVPGVADTTLWQRGATRADALAQLQQHPDGLTASQLADALGGRHQRPVVNQLLADMLLLEHVQRVPGSGTWVATVPACTCGAGSSVTAMHLGSCAAAHPAQQRLVARLQAEPGWHRLADAALALDVADAATPAPAVHAAATREVHRQWARRHLPGVRPQPVLGDVPCDQPRWRTLAPSCLPACDTSDGRQPYLLATHTSVPTAWLRPSWDRGYSVAADAWGRLVRLLQDSPQRLDDHGCAVGQAVALYHLGTPHETCWGLAVAGRPVGVVDMASGPGAGSCWWAVAADAATDAMLRDCWAVADLASDPDQPLARLAMLGL